MSAGSESLNIPRNCLITRSLRWMSPVECQIRRVILFDCWILGACRQTEREYIATKQDLQLAYYYILRNLKTAGKPESRYLMIRKQPQSVCRIY